MAGRTKYTTASTACPVCGNPRGPATDHGLCMEIRAKTEGKNGSGVFNPKGREFTSDNIRKAKLNRVRNRYLKGDLPDWMLDK